LNTTIDIINKRISLRKYLDTPISTEDEAVIINSALRAPTAGNMMLYSILVIKDAEKKSTLSKTCDNQPFIATAPLILIFLADYQKLYNFYKLSNVNEYCKDKNMSFNGPDYASLMLGISDALVSAQNAVIAAESLGIGSCYIGDIMENYETHKALLNLPDFVFPIGMLTFGYYPDNTKILPRSRFKKEYVVFEEEYKNLSDTELMDMYSEWSKNFKENNIYDAKNAGQFNYARKTGTEFSIEMDRSIREAMKTWNGGKL
jgi:FMN reductase (NADPH)